MKDFRDKTIAITGAGSGLGRSFALQLYAAGARLALCDINLSDLEETLRLTGETGNRVSLHQVDVANREEIIQFSVEVLAQHGPADMLINNAGICLIPQPFEEISEEVFRKVLDVNMWGVYNGVRVFLPQLQSRDEASILIISSLAGIVGLYGHSAYSMSKSALRGFAEALQSEVAGSKITITLAHPGGVKTNLIRNAPNLEQDLQDKAHTNFTQLSFLTPEKTVLKILKAVQKKKNRVIIGFDARLIIAIRTLFPQKYTKILQVIFSQANFKDDPVWKSKEK